MRRAGNAFIYPARKCARAIVPGQSNLFVAIRHVPGGKLLVGHKNAVGHQHGPTRIDRIARITWDWVRAKPVKHAWESAQKNLTNEMRRAGATRLVDGRAVTQTLIHQSDAVLDMDWRPLYDAHTAIHKHMFETTHEFSPKINDRVRAMLAQWHDGNRHNLLNMGIIPMMHHAGWTDNQIRAALISDGGNPWLNRTIEKYINNIRGR